MAEMENMQTSFRATIDGGIGKQLPVEVDGWWDSDGGFNVEAVMLTHNGTTYDLYDSLHTRVIDRLAAKIEEDEHG